MFVFQFVLNGKKQKQVNFPARWKYGTPNRQKITFVCMSNLCVVCMSVMCVVCMSVMCVGIFQTCVYVKFVCVCQTCVCMSNLCVYVKPVCVYVKFVCVCQTCVCMSNFRGTQGHFAPMTSEVN